MQAISSSVSSAVTCDGVNRFHHPSAASSPCALLSPASRDATTALKLAVSSLAAAGASQTMEKQALAAELHNTQELLKEAEHSIDELRQSVCMWQELGQTLRDENSDLVAQVVEHARGLALFLISINSSAGGIQDARCCGV